MRNQRADLQEVGHQVQLVDQLLLLKISKAQLRIRKARKNLSKVLISISLANLVSQELLVQELLALDQHQVQELADQELLVQADQDQLVDLAQAQVALILVHQELLVQAVQEQVVLLALAVQEHQALALADQVQELLDQVLVQLVHQELQVLVLAVQEHQEVALAVQVQEHLALAHLVQVLQALEPQVQVAEVDQVLAVAESNS
jgi:hypothetical protein